MGVQFCSNVMQSLIINIYLYLSGEWLGVDLSKNTKTICVEKGLECMLT